MPLKTDYKNDKFPGKKKWKVGDGGDGTVTLDDVTPYESEGDLFNADDINKTNTQVNKNERDIARNTGDIDTVNARVTDVYNDLNQSISTLKAVKRAAFPAAGWTGGAPYTQTVAVAGITTNDAPVVGLDMSDNPDAAAAKAREKAFGYVKRGYTGSGTVTLICFASRPAADFVALIKGV